MINPRPPTANIVTVWETVHLGDQIIEKGDIGLHLHIKILDPVNPGTKMLLFTLGILHHGGPITELDIVLHQEQIEIIGSLDPMGEFIGRSIPCTRFFLFLTIHNYRKPKASR